jgi:hypothetical protein
LGKEVSDPGEYNLAVIERQTKVAAVRRDLSETQGPSTSLGFAGASVGMTNDFGVPDISVCGYLDITIEVCEYCGTWILWHRPVHAIGMTVFERKASLCHQP